MRATYVVAGIAAVIAVLFAAALTPLILSGGYPSSARESSNSYKPGAVLNRQAADLSATDSARSVPGLLVRVGAIEIR